MSAIQSYTTNYQFAKINFDFPRWHTYEHNNWDLLDAILSAFIANQQIKGLWVNSTIYAVNDLVLDGDLGILYLCLVNHTSAATGTFAADRTSNPTYWQPALITPSFRGAWVTATVYAVQDFVVHDGKYAICAQTHTSGADFDVDAAAGKWEVLVDVSDYRSPMFPSENNVNVASAATCDIGTPDAGLITITGTTTITSLGTAANKARLVRFSGALLLTHHATNLILPFGANITTAAGDTALFVSNSLGQWRCHHYQRASASTAFTDIKQAATEGSTGVVELATTTEARVRTDTTRAITPAGLDTALKAAPDLRRNRIINGGFRFNQELLHGTWKTTTGYFADQWYFTHTVAASGQARATTVGSSGFEGLTYHGYFECTTAKATLSASDIVLIRQPLEGLNMADFDFGVASARQMIVRFWAYGPAGTYHFFLNNAGDTQSFIAAFTLTGSTWTLVEIPILRRTAGTWPNTNAHWGNAGIVLAAGSDWHGSAGWQASGKRATSAQKNFLDSTSNVFAVANFGLKLDADNVGKYGTWELDDYAYELRRCQRYFQFLPAWNGQWVTTTVLSLAGLFFEPMRLAPSATLIAGTAAALEIGVSTRDVSGLGLSATPFSGYINLTTATATLGAFGIFDTAVGRIDLDARL